MLEHAKSNFPPTSALLIGAPPPGGMLRNATLLLGICVAVALYVCRRATRLLKRRRLYVMRHGIKQENLLSRDNYSTELRPEGIKALAVLRTYLDEHGVRFASTLSSPFLRCRQTAEVLVPHHQIEPGLAETLNDRCGLRDGSGGSGTLARVVQLVQATVEGCARDKLPRKWSPLVSASELERDEGSHNPQSMARARKLVDRLKVRCPLDGDWPILLVTHGCAAHGIIQACLHPGQVPTWDKSFCPPMGAMTVLETSDGGGSWSIVGTVCPVLRSRGSATGDDDAWECRWSAGIVGGADPAGL